MNEPEGSGITLYLCHILVKGNGITNLVFSWFRSNGIRTVTRYFTVETCGKLMHIMNQCPKPSIVDMCLS